MPHELGAINPGLWGFAQVYRTNPVQGLLPAWSLCIELTFYAAAPCLAAALYRRDRLEPYALIAVWIGSLAISIASPGAIVGHTRRRDTPVGSRSEWVSHASHVARSHGLARRSCGSRRSAHSSYSLCFGR